MYKYSLPMFLDSSQGAQREELGTRRRERTRALAPLLSSSSSASRARSSSGPADVRDAPDPHARPQLFGERVGVFTGATLSLMGTASGGGGGAMLPPWAHADRAPAFGALAQALRAVQLPFSDGQWGSGPSERCKVEFPSSVPADFTPFHRSAAQALRP